MDLSVVGCTSTHWVSVSNRHCTKQQIPWVIKRERLCFMAQMPESRAAEEVRDYLWAQVFVLTEAV